jgi:hypothetical protein
MMMSLYAKLQPHLNRFIYLRQGQFGRYYEGALIDLCPETLTLQAYDEWGNPEAQWTLMLNTLTEFMVGDRDLDELSLKASLAKTVSQLEEALEIPETAPLHSAMPTLEAEAEDDEAAIIQLFAPHSFFNNAEPPPSPSKQPLSALPALGSPTQGQPFGQSSKTGVSAMVHQALKYGDGGLSSKPGWFLHQPPQTGPKTPPTQGKEEQGPDNDEPPALLPTG